MSYLVRFGTGPGKVKARMFDSGSRKQECQLCGERRFGVLFRFSDPKKQERTICHECLAILALNGMPTPEPIIKEVIKEVPVEVVKVIKTRKKRKKRSLTSKQDQDNGSQAQD